MRTREIWRPVAVSPGWREVRTDLHHTFVMIHPFQDGNGRIARLLASFVLIRDGLFPLVLDREQRTRYIDALEAADRGDYQPLVDLFADNQISSIAQALNWQILPAGADYQAVLQVLQQKLSEQRSAAPEQDDIGARMHAVHDQINRHLAAVVADLKQQLHADVARTACPPDHAQAHFYLRQLIDYAKRHRYYLNTALPRSWLRLIIDLGQARAYRLVISLHHYGHGGRTFALGAFLSLALASGKTPEQTEACRSDRYLDIPLAIPPLILAADAERSDLERVVDRHIDQILTAALAVIANAL